MKKLGVAVALAAGTLLMAAPAFAQNQHRQGQGQAIVTVLPAHEGEQAVSVALQDVKVKINGKQSSVTSWTPLRGPDSRIELVLLIDSGASRSLGEEMGELRQFIQETPSNTKIAIAYMENGRAAFAGPLSANPAEVERGLHLPGGFPGSSASPYFCLSEFAKRWPGAAPEGPRNPEALAPLGPASAGARKARFVLMITNGVDPYNGSTSPMNQNSPYVDTAVRDAQRAGVAVYSIFFSDAGFRGGRANFSGQSYLAEVAEGTGGTAYFQGTSNPVSLIPFFEQFEKSISETYVATFDAAGRDLVRIKASTDLPKTKLRTAQLVRPGTQLAD